MSYSYGVLQPAAPVVAAPAPAPPAPQPGLFAAQADAAAPAVPVAAPAAAAVALAAPGAAKKKNSMMMLAVGGLVLAVVIGLIIFFVLNAKPKEEEDTPNPDDDDNDDDDVDTDTPPATSAVSVKTIKLYKTYSPSNKAINVRQIEAYNGATKLDLKALGTIVASSTYENYAADRAIDGKAESFAHTNDSTPSLTYTFTSPQPVTKIVILNRKDDCCAPWLAGTMLDVRDGSNSAVFSRFLTADLTQTFDLSTSQPATSTAKVVKSITVSKTGAPSNDDLPLNVRQIEAFDGERELDLKSLGTIKMSSQYQSYTPQYAIDGVKKSFVHTASFDTSPWLTYTFNAPTSVTRISILNRLDCCQNRMKGASLVVKDGAGAVLLQKTLDASAVQEFTL